MQSVPRPNYANSLAISSTTSWLNIYTDVAVTNRPYRYITHADYESGLATAGTWNVSPTRLWQVGSNSKLPGDLIQTTGAKVNNQTTTTASTFVQSGATFQMNPISPLNMLKVMVTGDCGGGSGGLLQGYLAINGNNAIHGVQQISYQVSAAAGFNNNFALQATYLPGTTAAQTFMIYFNNGGTAGVTVYIPATFAFWIGEEIMG
jgi:hypothetical protein